VYLCRKLDGTLKEKIGILDEIRSIEWMHELIGIC
jgi:hypothetical protein